MSELPAPRTVTDELLVAVHERLGEILERLPPRQSAPAGEGEPVELSEPAQSKAAAKKAAARRPR